VYERWSPSMQMRSEDKERTDEESQTSSTTSNDQTTTTGGGRAPVATGAGSNLYRVCVLWHQPQYRVLPHRRLTDLATVLKVQADSIGSAEDLIKDS
jgi:hypothetical protein